MTTRTLIAMTLATALFATACEKKAEEAAEAEAPEAAAPAVDLAAEEEAIRNRSAEWMNYVNAKDTASVVNTVYAPDAISAFGEINRGTSEIQEWMEKNAKQMPDAVWSWNSTSVKVAASGDMAVEKGDYYFDPDGDGKKPQTSGNYVTVWEKVGDSWRVISDVGADKPAET